MAAPRVVYVVDDEASARRALSRLLTVAGYAVEEFASATEFLRIPEIDGPACLMLDLRMPDVSGLDAVEVLVRRRSTLGVNLISGHADIGSSVRAMKLGATDFLSKPFDESDILSAVGSAFAASTAKYSQRLEQARLHARFETLTPRERDVCALVAEGLMNKQIASALGRSEKTVKIHRGHVMSKLSLGSVAELVRFFDRVVRARSN